MKALVFPILLAIASLFVSVPAQADTPISKCYTRICIGPAASVAVTDYRLTDHKISAGTVALGYQIRTLDSLFGIGIYLDTKIGQDVTNQLELSSLVMLFKTSFLGVKYHDEGSARWFSIIGAIGVGD